MKSFLLFFIGLVSITLANAQHRQPPYGKISTTRETVVHDPVMMKQDSVFYLFCTGWGISIYSSVDMKNWKLEKPVFETPPQWATNLIPEYKGHTWAPDISYYNGLYYLYYSVSAFGKNTSCIGVVTNPTLHPSDKAYKWTDHGLVIQSVPGQTNWNAIDPNLITDEKGNPYLVFGSFWDGLKLVKLTPDRLSVAEDIHLIPTIASRKKDPAMKGNLPAIDNNPVDAGGNAIEAPFIFKKDGYYYLFASIDYCCKGINSTYKMIVGRSKDLQGPYKDKEGVDMARAGGSIVLQGDNSWYGVGHNAVVSIDGKEYLVFHGYDAADNGKPKLRIEPISWKDGWPEVKP
jgi:arabinan endo-1,5-alpha-L-arabinosidase